MIKRAGEYDDKKRNIKKKKIFIEVASVDPASMAQENKTYLWGKDRNTKKMISLDSDECVSLMDLLLWKVKEFKIFHDPYAKTANAKKASSTITAQWQSGTDGNSIQFTVSVKKLGELKGTMFNYKVPKNDILYLKSLCLEVISRELELPEDVVYQMVKDNIV